MRILSVFILIAVIGCRSDNFIPKNILKQDEMELIMWDLMRADKFVTDFMLKDTTVDRKKESFILYEEIYQLHSTSEEEFKRSLQFYQHRPDLLKPITDSLRSYERKVMENEFEVPMPVKDSSGKKKLIRTPVKD